MSQDIYDAAAQPLQVIMTEAGNLETLAGIALGKEDPELLESASRLKDAVTRLARVLRDFQKGTPFPTFHEAWKGMEEKGYQYGEDALEQVRFGWEIHETVCEQMGVLPKKSGKV